MFRLGMVSTNLFMLFYVGGYIIQIAEGWKWQGIFSYKWVRFARADKDVALQYHYRRSTHTNVCGG